MGQKFSVVASVLPPQGIYAVGNIAPWPNLQENNHHISGLIKGGVAIMDSNTYDTKKPFPDTVCIIVGKDDELIKGQVVVKSTEEAIDYAKSKYPSKDIFFLGGRDVWLEGMKHSNNVFLTKIKVPGRYNPEKPIFGPIEMFPEILDLNARWQVRDMTQRCQRIESPELNDSIRIVYMDFIHFEQIDVRDMVIQD